MTAVPIEKRNVSKARRDKILAAQDHVCKRAGCDERATDVDHIIPLWMGGSNRDDNLEGLCPAHHRGKTKAEASIRGKVKRIAKREAGEKKPSRIKSRGFGKLTRKFDGTVSPKRAHTGDEQAALSVIRGMGR